MVYNFPLPTTAHLSFQSYLSSSTHPSLPQAASTARHILRLALKAHKQLTPRERESHLQTVLNALNEYLPFLFAISHGLSEKSIRSGGGVDEEVEITLRDEPEIEWRPGFASSSLFKGAKVRGRGIDFEVAMVVSTLGYVLAGLARVETLRTLYASVTPPPEKRASSVQYATKLLLQASSAHSLLASSSFTSTEGSPAAPQLNTAIQTALDSLALAEATLLAVLKDDAYTFACIQSRNPQDKDWMVRSPEIPKVRALLFARLCVRGAEYAEQAAAGLGSAGSKSRGSSSSSAGKVDEDLIKYAQTLGKVARARACRFFGVDLELSGKVGEGIAWLRAGKGALGLKRAMIPEGEGGGSGKGSALSKIKKGWTDRREERKLEKSNTGASTTQNGELLRGDDAGWEEEGRVIEMLETKWVKMNDTVCSYFCRLICPMQFSDSRIDQRADCSPIGTSTRKSTFWPGYTQRSGTIYTSIPG
jgi:hypothetical protein